MKRKVTILIVEDNPADVELVREALNGQGFEGTIAVAADGAEALAHLQRGAGYENAAKPDLVLLDLNLPRRHGLEVLRAMRENEPSRRIPVLVFTSSTARADIVACYEQGANCYIPKPVDYSGYEAFARLTLQFWLDLALLPPP